MSRGLRQYLEQKHAAMSDAAIARPTEDQWRETVEAVVVADDATGVRKLRIRDWQYIGDSGPSFGGWGLGPSSPELFCGVLGTCLTHTYLIGAAMLAIPVDRVSVRVTAANNDAAFLDISQTDPRLPWDITARVDLSAPDATPAQRDQLHAYAHERCPLTNLVRTANEVKILT